MTINATRTAASVFSATKTSLTISRVDAARPAVKTETPIKNKMDRQSNFQRCESASRNNLRPLDIEYPLSGWCCNLILVPEYLGST